MEKIVNIHMIVNDIHNHKFTIHKLDGAEFFAISSVDHIFHWGQGHDLSNSSIPKENNKTNKKRLKIKHHSGLGSTQVRKSLKIKVLSEQQKGQVSESCWPKGRELYHLSLKCFERNTRVPSIAIPNTLVLSWKQIKPSSYTEDTHVSKPPMTSTSVLVHETRYQIHTGIKHTPVFISKGNNNKNNIHLN